MDTCRQCTVVIKNSSYRETRGILCHTCGAELLAEREAGRKRALMRGILFVCLAACIGFLGRWAFEANIVGDGQYDFLNKTAAHLRGYLYLGVGILVGLAAAWGSRETGSTLLAAIAGTTTYLASPFPWCP